MMGCNGEKGEGEKGEGRGGGGGNYVHFCNFVEMVTFRCNHTKNNKHLPH